MSGKDETLKKVEELLDERNQDTLAKLRNTEPPSLKKHRIWSELAGNVVLTAIGAWLFYHERVSLEVFLAIIGGALGLPFVNRVTGNKIPPSMHGVVLAMPAHAKLAAAAIAQRFL